MIAKRLFDIVASSLGLVLLAPFLLLISVAIKLESHGPVFFRQERVGQFGVLFHIHKFRTMVHDAERLGLQITVGADVRVTKVGKLLRKYKMDELAQLIDVLRGCMSLVGPRPEVPKYVQFYTDEIREIVFSVKPGITDLASIEFRDENEILAAANDPHQAYVKNVLPIKIGYYVSYVKNQTFLGDIKIIFATFVAIVK